ncbi:MAG: GAF domain-containing protein [Bacteroidota bacterium]
MMKSTSKSGPTTSSEEYMNMMNAFPLKTRLSFEYLINYWKWQAETETSPEHFLAKVILEKLEKAPELTQPIEDLSKLDKHKELVRFLASAIVPNAADDALMAVFPPFKMDLVYGTEEFKTILEENVKNPTAGFLAHNDPTNIKKMKSLNAVFMVLNKYYGTSFDIYMPYTFSMVNKKTGLRRYYKSVLEHKFSDIVNTGGLPVVTKEDIKDLLKNPDNVAVWIDRLHLPDHFEVHGLVAIALIDVTTHEIISLLKNRLLNKESLTKSSYFKLLQDDLTSLLSVPDLVLGLSAYTANNEDTHQYSRRLWNSFMLGKSENEFDNDYYNSVVETIIATKRPYIEYDLKEKANLSIQEKHLLKRGIRNLMIAPLFDNGELEGLLEFGSKTPGTLNELTAVSLKEVGPLFTSAMVRSKEEFANRLEAIIKEKCTAIHKSVEWKFMDAAFELMLKREKDHASDEMAPIVFKDVFPLYGQSDIRGSSDKRNEAAVKDLIANLAVAIKTIERIQKKTSFPLMDQVKYRIDQHINNLESGLGSGDEEKILDFLVTEINPLFKNIEQNYPEHAKTIARYQKELDPDLGLVYMHRHDYEKSVRMINETISGYLDQENAKAQDIMPHYFEKYKTDGVEYNIYAGGSMLAKHNFDQISLSNLRLWQLITMCHISQKTITLKHQLPIPMGTAELILIHSAPLAIRFRYDEKRFDVDGTYNIRYEILKKRIDKAIVRGTNERLTQEGKISIVYSNNRDLPEYFKFLEYLQHKQYIIGEIEDLELDRLQGVQGLKALRITVNPEIKIENPKFESTAAKVS